MQGINLYTYTNLLFAEWNFDDLRLTNNHNTQNKREFKTRKTNAKQKFKNKPGKKS